MIIFIITNLKDITHKIIDPCVEKQCVRYISLVGNGEPQLEVLLLLLQGLLVDFNASLEADGVNLLL